MMRKPASRIACSAAPARAYALRAFFLTPTPQITDTLGWTQGGRLLAMTLGRHAHRTTVEPFDHRNLGFKPEDLREYARAAKLDVIACERLTRERRPPHFEVLSLLARKP